MNLKLHGNRACQQNSGIILVGERVRFSTQNVRGTWHSGVGRMQRLGCLAWLCIAAVAGAQCDPPASLHHRTKELQDNSTPPVTKLISQSTIPTEASGEYLFGSDPNDVIQISLGDNELGGYISRHGEAENDQGAPLTLFFAHTWLDGPRLGFDTHEIHGVSYSFEGTIVRGAAKAATEAGYYLLRGTLTQSQGGKSQPRQVSMKLARHSAG
jgi:hypothetical protein